MKMKARKYLFAVWALLMSAVSLSSCDVDFYRDSAPSIRKVDENALILGPKSAGDINYIEETLKLGLGKYIDAILKKK